MGLLTPNKNEITLFQRMFEEKVSMIGVEGFYHEVKELNLSPLSSYNPEFYEAIKINFLFEEMPNPKTLRNLNWWDDSDDTTPPIAHIPWHSDKDKQVLLKPSVGSVLEIKDVLSGFSRFFEIQEINANSLYLVNYIVKLTPMRTELKVNASSKPFEETLDKGGGQIELLTKRSIHGKDT